MQDLERGRNHSLRMQLDSVNQNDQQKNRQLDQQITETHRMKDEAQMQQQENQSIKLEYNRLSEQFEVLREKMDRQTEEHQREQHMAEERTKAFQLEVDRLNEAHGFALGRARDEGASWQRQNEELRREN